MKIVQYNQHTVSVRFFFKKKYKILPSNHIYKQEYIQHLLSWLCPDVSSIYYHVVLKNQVIFFFFIFLYFPNFLR